MGPTIDRRAIPGAARESRWTAPDGHAIRRIDWPAPADRPARGALLFLPGRGDCYEKYLETLAHWHAGGWRVTALDWRGQAGSGRFSPRDGAVGDVPDFAVWIADLAAFWREWTRETPAPHAIVAHSMGGHLALRALAERAIAPAAAVLSAPMLGFTAPGPTPLLHGFARLMCRIGDPQRRAWRESEKPGEVPSHRAQLLTHDAARYADEAAWRVARPELAMGPASWRWVERAYASNRALSAPGVLEAVLTPVLLLCADRDGLVDARAIRRAAARLPHGQLAAWGAEAYHELLREADPVRDQVLAAADAFLAAAAPQPG